MLIRGLFWCHGVRVSIRQLGYWHLNIFVFRCHSMAFGSPVGVLLHWFLYCSESETWHASTGNDICWRQITYVCVKGIFFCSWGIAVSCALVQHLVCKLCLVIVDLTASFVGLCRSRALSQSSLLKKQFGAGLWFSRALHLALLKHTLKTNVRRFLKVMNLFGLSGRPLVKAIWFGALTQSGPVLELPRHHRVCVCVCLCLWQRFASKAAWRPIVV